MNRRALWIVVLICFCLSAVLQTAIDPMRKQFEPQTKGLVGKVSGLPAEYIFGTMLGFREVIAGVLWVRADEFFHEGNYDAILPIIRLVTWLDPRNIDVFCTGAWHIGYNFTDTEQRSDRRYLPAAIRLLDEGAAANPDVYDIFFELGWMWFDKVRMAQESVPWFQRANAFPDRPDETKPGIPPARRHMLCHAWERSGQIEKAMEAWESIMESHEAFLQRAGKDDLMAFTNLEVAKRNYAALHERQYNRYEKQPKPDTQPPQDVEFDAQVKVLAPKIIEVSGTCNLGKYYNESMRREETRPGRVDMVLRQDDFHLGILLDSNPQADHSWRTKGFSFDVPDVTVCQDMLFIGNGKFKRRINMAEDPMMYGFKAPTYILTVRYTPQYAPSETQDRIGWRGEGLTDKRYLKTMNVTVTDVDGVKHSANYRYVIKRFRLTREQLVGGSGTGVPVE